MNQLIQQIEYANCPQHNEELSMVCLYGKCASNLLICAICEQQLHQGHQVVSLKQYLDGSLFQSSVSEQIFDEMISMQQTKKQILTKMSSLRQNFIAQIYELQQKIISYFGMLQDKLMLTSSLNNQNKILQMINRANISHSAQHFFNLVSNLRIYNTSYQTDSMKYFQNEAKNKISSLNLILKKIKFTQHFKSLGSVFTIKNPSFKPIYIWSQQKAQNIVINEMIASQTSSSSGGERFALMTSSYGDIKQEDIVVSLKIRKLKGWIGVGICLHNVIVNCNYKFNYTQNYHGSYLISANGYCWSHSQTSFNSSLQSFTFLEGDTIKITYQVDKNCVTFQKVNQTSHFKLEVIKPPYGDYYVPCVNMCNPGDQVEIVK